MLATSGGAKIAKIWSLFQHQINRVVNVTYIFYKNRRKRNGPNYMAFEKNQVDTFIKSFNLTDFEKKLSFAHL